MSRQLDMAIAKLLEYETVIKPADEEWEADYYMRLPSKEYTEIPQYSTDGNEMLELVKEMQERGYELDDLQFNEKRKWHVRFTHTKIVEVFANTLPKAIAIATYKALKGEDWIE